VWVNLASDQDLQLSASGEDGVGVEETSAENLVLRCARADDSPHLLAWRNDPAAVKNSESLHAITFDIHQAWFEMALTSDECFLLVAEQKASDALGMNRVGTCRFDLVSTHSAAVSLNVNPFFRGQGFSLRVLREGIQIFSKHFSSIESLAAKILPTNRASQKVFFTSGFRLVDSSQRFGRWEKRIS